MKITNFKSIALLAMAGSVLLTANARAGAIASATGDLFLGVRANGGTGSTTEVVVDLGSAADVTRANQTVSIPGLASALSSAFGADWASRADLAVGVVGTSGNPNYSLYASKTAGAPWAPASLTAQAVTGNKVNSMMGSYVSSGGGVSTPLSRSTGVSGSWSSFAKISTVSPFNPLAFGAFTAAFEATPGQALELYKIDVGATTKDLGGLTLNSDGSVTFATPSANAANSTVSFSDIYVRAPKGATTVTLNLVRTGGTNPATAVVTLDGNTATAAFGTGAKFTSVTLPLAPSTTVAGTKHTATLSTGLDTTGATTVTASGSTTVYAAGFDSSIPAVALTAPTTTAVVTGAAGVTAGNVTITGTADSSFGIDDVSYSINGGAFVALTKVPSTVAATPNKVSFTSALTGVLTINGVNTIVVRALSVNGQINTVTRLVRFVAAPAKGGIAVTAVDASNAAVSFTSPAAFIGALSGATAFTAGNTYAITAPQFNTGVTAATTTDASLVFSYWTIGSSATHITSLSTTFVASADIFANGIKAHYIANPFQSTSGAAATAAAAGTYSGLIKAATGFTASNDATGLINVTLSSRGALSGNIKIHSATYTFVSGALANDGTVLFGVAPAQVPFTTFNPGGTTVVLKFDLAAKTLSGQLYTSTSLSNISASLQSVATAATYTFHAPTLNGAALTAAGLTVDTFPQGDTIGSFALNTAASGNNVVSGTISLGDSKVATFSAFYTGAGVIPLYVSPYGSTAITAGSYSGLLTVAAGSVSGTCTWFRPAGVLASAYSAGWPAGVATTVAGGTFTNTASPLFTGALALGNVTTFDKTGTGLAANPTVAGGVDIGGSAPAYTFTKHGTAISFGSYTNTTGILSGALPFSFKGVVIQNGATPGIYGYYSTLSTSPAGVKQGLFTIHP